MKLISPWVNYYREVEALFKEDPEVHVVFDDETYELKLYVDNNRKAEALTALLPTEKTFGNVGVKIEVIPANNGERTYLDLVIDAFEGNPALEYVQDIDTPMGKFNYVVFKSEVVQYFNDDISDVNGNRSTLYQNIAEDVFGLGTGLHFCTAATEETLEKPLGEWP